uniref:DUF4758 domain-containing protein n=2 Tax=Stomoxys calcitrans TaxID=35570 RepID=A0A1I8PHH8_STOCA
MGEENSIAKYTTYILLICFMQQINGLSLASTARTFILDGLTTEYATEVILKTPGNSKTYSHVTKKSSRVLYGTAAPLDSHIFSDGHTFANYINPERIFYSNKSTPIDPKLNSQEKLSDFRTASKTKKNSCTTHANCTTNAASNFAFHRNLSTVIYYGFADFTTMVGESVIIFSPSEMNPLFETNMPNMSGDSESVQITEKVENDLPTSAVLDASAMVPDNEKRNTQVWKDLESVGPHPEFTPITDNHFQNDIIIDSRTNEQQQDNMIQSLISPSKVSSNGELSEELQDDPSNSLIEYTKYSTIDNFTDTNHRRRRRSTNSKSRFRRPRPLPETREEPRRVEETTKAPPPQTGNFRTRTKKPEAAANNSNGSNKRVIRPSHVSANASSRSKFTLREKEFPATTERSVTTAKRPPFRKPQASSGIKSKRPSSTPSSQLLSGKRRLNN